MWLHGQVKDTQGRPVENAIVDIWHANTLGNYSFFDQSQSEYNLRRRIRTGADGRYSVRSIVPSGTVVRQMVQPKNCWIASVVMVIARRIFTFSFPRLGISTLPVRST